MREDKPEHPLLAESVVEFQRAKIRETVTGAAVDIESLEEAPAGTSERLAVLDRAHDVTGPEWVPLGLSEPRASLVTDATPRDVTPEYVSDAFIVDPPPEPSPEELARAAAERRRLAREAEQARIIARLGKFWDQQPDLRFGQLMDAVLHEACWPEHNLDTVTDRAVDEGLVRYARARRLVL